MATAPIASIVETTALDPAARVDPDTKLRLLRETHPIYRDEAMKVWLLTGYAQVRAALNDRSLLRYPGNAEPGSISRHLIREDTPDDTPRGDRQSILTLDDPDHSRIRTPLALAFYARVAKARPMIDRIVDDFLTPLTALPSFDLVAEATIHIPIVVLARIIGVEPDRIAEFRVWSEDVLLSLNPMRTAEESVRTEAAKRAVSDYVQALLDARRLDPRDDLATDMVQAQAAGAPISDTEICINMLALLIAGNVTTTDLLTSAVMLLLKNPGELAKLKANPSLMPAAVEEILRTEGPADVTARIAPEPRVVGGCPMGKGASMMLSTRGANRDPDVFTDPDKFDITRKGPPHVAFGGGSHICIGAPLARMEAVAFLGHFLERFPNVRLADEPLQWRALPFFRGLKKLTLINA